MRALVTGGAGFIGSHLVDSLLDDGVEVHVLDNLSTGRRQNLVHAVMRGATLHVGSVTDGDAVTAAMAAARPDVVYHLAAQIDVRRSVGDPGFDATVNVVGTSTVLEGARVAGARRVLLASSAATYGTPMAVPLDEDAPILPESPYGASKAAAEIYMRLYAQLHGLSTASLRMSNVYGPRQDPHGEAGVIAIFCDATATGRVATIFGDGSQTRDYVYVGDVVNAFRAAGASDARGAFNVSTGRETSLVELAAALGLRTRRGPRRAGEIDRSCLDPSRAAEVLGWRAAVDLHEGLRGTVEPLAA